MSAVFGIVATVSGSVEAFADELASTPVHREAAVSASNQNAYGRALIDITPPEWALMRAGKSVFVRTWVAAAGEGHGTAGLGPLYNADSCVSCHFKDGRGGIEHRSRKVAAPLIFRLKDSQDAGGPAWGRQIQTRSVPPARPEATVSTSYVSVEGRYPDGTRYRLRRPVHRVSRAVKAALSARIPPTLVGIGFLEAVAPSEILGWADPEDRDKNGISGRASRLRSGQLGRFGWRAQQPSIPGQVAAALSEDMGIATSAHPYAGCAEQTAACRRPHSSPEITDEDFQRLIDYLRSLAPPAARPHTAESRRGARLFASIGCADCHRPDMETPKVLGINGPGGLSAKRIHPYSDLLLHDMGPGLADDGVDEPLVARTEWRTAPLWGLGLLRTVNGGMRLLHDGRARTFEEAILWHGGEAAATVRRFVGLSSTERSDLVAFLRRI